MNGFLTRLLDRQWNSGNSVSPQARGRFEPATSLSMFKTEQFPFEKKAGNIESAEEPLNANVESFENPVPSFKQESKSLLRENLNINSKEVFLEKLPTELINNSGNPVNSDVKIKVNAKTAFSEKDHQEKHDEAQNVIRKDIAEFVVKPANNETGIYQSINNVIKRGNISNPKDGVLKTPKWLGDWNAGGNQVKEIKVTHEQSSPTIKVNIGRIEVRAVMQPVHTIPQQTEPPKPKSSLDDYLNKSNK